MWFKLGIAPSKYEFIKRQMFKVLIKAKNLTSIVTITQQKHAGLDSHYSAPFVLSLSLQINTKGAT
jgi:hypothetical protein